MHGFLGTRGSLMLDVVFTAMFAVVPLMAWSLWQVRRHRRYERHKRIQLGLATVLLIAVAGLEIEIRVTGWEERASRSPYWEPGRWNDAIDWALAVHLLFAVPTLVLWVVVIARALVGFPRPARPSPHSRQHILWARLAAVGTVLTALTGWTFYALAFAAT